MHEECIIAEFADAETARLGLEVLAKAGYGENHVSIVARHDEPALRDVDELEKKKADSSGVGSGVGVGGALGGALAIPLAASTLLGPFILIGPLVGAGLGAALGGMFGGASSEKDAAEYFRTSVEKGSILVIVTGGNAELLDAKASVQTAGPVKVTRFRIPSDVENVRPESDESA